MLLLQIFRFCVMLTNYNDDYAYYNYTFDPCGKHYRNVIYKHLFEHMPNYGNLTIVGYTYVRNFTVDINLANNFLPLNVNMNFRLFVYVVRKVKKVVKHTEILRLYLMGKHVVTFKIIKGCKWFRMLFLNKINWLFRYLIQRQNKSDVIFPNANKQSENNVYLNMHSPNMSPKILQLYFYT